MEHVAETEQLRRQLEADAAAWSERRDETGLLDPAQLGELASWLPAARREPGLSAAAESFIAASRAAAGSRWWPSRTQAAGALAVLLILMLLATPIVLLMIVVLTARVIHLFG